MDFYKIKTRVVRKNGEDVIEVYPDFVVRRSEDLMIRAKSFYAVWDDEVGLWSTDEYDVQRLVDKELRQYVEENEELSKYRRVDIKLMSDFSSNSWKNFKNYLTAISDSAEPLDSTLTFSDTPVRKKDYASKRLSYSMRDGSRESYDKIISTLYDPQERDKLEWAIGAIIAGDAQYIQKFLVLYGSAGTGKSTILNIVQRIFEGYYTTFEAKALVGTSNSFSTEVFRGNPLVAIQHDGDLSRIEDNTKLNSIVSHDEMTINEKYKPTYSARSRAFLFMGTNTPVKITDAKSGIIRRLIDVQPSGRLLPIGEYQVLISRVEYELGAIAHHCLSKFRSMGPAYYNDYLPIEMMLQTDVFYNFIEYNYDIFSREDGIDLTRAYNLYKVYCEESNVDYKLSRHHFREELKNYFDNFYDRRKVDGEDKRSYFEGFKTSKFTSFIGSRDKPLALTLDEKESIFDRDMGDLPAQYATDAGTPTYKWANVVTRLKDIDTSKVHFVKVPENHIVVDFDLTDGDGEKDPVRNLEAASKYPPTYSEFSKSGGGVHLHYIWEGDPEELASEVEPGIEVKVYSGNSSLRRRYTLSNKLDIAHISDGLPKKEKKMLDQKTMASEKGVRDLIIRNLRKEIHPGTKPSVDFIFKILTDAKNSGMSYDVSDLRNDVFAFAMNSTNQSEYCMALVSKMPFQSDPEVSEFVGVEESIEPPGELVYFDLEVYPNLFYISWKFEGPDKKLVHMFNPTPDEVGELLKMKLVGFNNRKYDNHILYGRYMGYDNQQLFELSQRIINNERHGASFSEAYNLSYADVYDYTTKKQSLKKWQLALGIKHMEMEIPWDEDVPEELWPLVAEYCDNDVISTEAVANARRTDMVAREILAELSGLRINDTNRAHTTRIIFGNNRKPQGAFNYVDLSEEFSGYNYDYGKSHYRGEITGEGGYVYSEPGIYENVITLDIESMHPTTIVELDLFGPYTEKFSDMLKARLAIKHENYDEARKLMDGALVPYLKDESDAKSLANALKLVLNSVYGFTSAKFDNPFRDIRNVDNIVAKRGALFMVDLKNAVQDEGYIVAHIKTDSIKIPNADPYIIDFIIDFGAKYGYEFQIEDVFEKFCLVNDAVYVGYLKASDEEPAQWTATGAQFKQPYVFKTLFSKEGISFEDKCETKAVTTSMYLDFNEDLDEDDHDYKFVGKVGVFCPVKPNSGGGILLRKKDDKFYAVTGTKGYRWLEANTIQGMDMEYAIDLSYFDALVQGAKDTIGKFGDVEAFIS